MAPPPTVDAATLPAATLLAAAVAASLAAGGAAMSARTRPPPGAAWIGLAFGALALSLLPAIAWGLPDHGSWRDRIALALLAIPPWAITHQVYALTLAPTRWLRTVDLTAMLTVAWALLVTTDPAASWDRAGTGTITLWALGGLLVATAWLAVRAMLRDVARTDPRIARIRSIAMQWVVLVFLVAYVTWIAAPVGTSTNAAAALGMAFGSALLMLVAVLPRPVSAVFDQLGGRAMVRAIEALVASDDLDRDLHGVLDAFADALGVDGLGFAADGQVVEFGGRSAQPLRLAEHAPPELRQQVGTTTLVAWPTRLVPQVGRRRRHRLDVAARLLHAASERDRLRLVERRTAEHASATAAALGAANQALQETNELKGQFVSLVSHELRTPLTSIIGLARTAHDRWDELDEAQLREFQQIIAEQGDRLDRLVRELLLIGRIEEGRITVASQEVELATLTEQAILDAGIEHGPVRIARPRSIQRVRTDPTFLHEVLVNYLSNARKYGQPPIEMRFARHGERLEVAVEDHGDPIPPEFRSKLFDRFTRSPAAARTPGTGLGLAIVRELARALGGEAWHESVPGGGNRFSVSVPVEWIGHDPTPPRRRRTTTSSPDQRAIAPR